MSVTPMFSTDPCRAIVKAKIRDLLPDIRLYTEQAATSTGTEQKTALLNLQHAVGKYHGLMEVLDEVDLDSMVYFHDLFDNAVTEALKALESVYE